MRRLTLHDSLERHFGLGHAQVRPLAGGRTSTTWLVETHGVEGARWVAKVVGRDDRPGLLRGAEAAAAVEAAGICAGAAEPTTTGDLVVDLTDGCLALLRWVDGVGLTGADDADQARMGRTLALAHRALARVRPAEPARFPPLDLDAPHLDVRPWVRPAVAAAVDAFEQLAAGARPASGVLHGDPAPESFRWWAERGRCGLVGWRGTVTGPRLYDVASAVVHVGGPAQATALLAAYAEDGALPPGEVEAGLDVLVRLRWAVQADVLARRLAHGDLAGVARPQDDARELMAAHAHLHPG